MPAGSLASSECFEKLRQNLVDVANNAEIGHTEDGCFSIFVDGDDVALKEFSWRRAQ